MTRVSCPWGEDDTDDPALAARLFAWEHFVFGHRYVVLDWPDCVEIVCDCGETFDDGGQL